MKPILVLILIFGIYCSPENAKIIWNFLKNKGLTDAGAAGLMGNINAESGLESVIYQNSCKATIGLTDKEYVEKVNDGSYTNFVHDGVGFGLVQWTFWSRKEDFLKACKTDIGDLTCQLEFLIKELKADFPHVLDVLKNSDDVKECSDLVFDDYEGPGDDTGPRRYKFAMDYYKTFALGEKGGKEQTYVIASGDTLGSIAAKFNTTIEELCKLNDIKDPNTIYAGQVLTLPGGEEDKDEDEGQTNSYIIASGDTLSGIATKFNTTVEELCKLNDIEDPDVIYAGQVLILPEKK